MRGRPQQPTPLNAKNRNLTHVQGIEIASEIETTTEWTTIVDTKMKKIEVIPQAEIEKGSVIVVTSSSVTTADQTLSKEEDSTIVRNAHLTGIDLIHAMIGLKMHRDEADRDSDQMIAIEAGTKMVLELVDMEEKMVAMAKSQ